MHDFACRSPRPARPGGADDASLPESGVSGERTRSFRNGHIVDARDLELASVTQGPEKFAAGIGTAVKTLLGGEAHTIATLARLAVRDDLIAMAEQRLGFVSKGAAEEILAAHLAANPADRGTLQVVPRLELPQAA
jgi:hypothetical protein